MRALRGGDSGPILRLDYKRNTVDVEEAVATLRAAQDADQGDGHGADLSGGREVHREDARSLSRDDLHQRLLRRQHRAGRGADASGTAVCERGHRDAGGAGGSTATRPSVLKYKTALAKYFPGEAADYVSLEGYMAASLLAEGLQRAGPQIDTEKLVDALESMRNFDLGVGTLAELRPDRASELAQGMGHPARSGRAIPGHRAAMT